MRKLFFLATLLLLVPVFSALGQTTGFVLLDTAMVSSPAVSISDTGYTGTAYRFSYMSSTATTTTSSFQKLSASSELAREFLKEANVFSSSSGLQKTVGGTDTLVSYVVWRKDYSTNYLSTSNFGFWYFVPGYAAQKVTRIAVGFVNGNTIVATTGFAYTFATSGWQWVQLSVNVSGQSFSSIFLAMSCLPNEGGYRVDFVDDLTLLGTPNTVIDNGNGIGLQPVTPTLVSPADSSQYTLPAMPNLQWSSESADTGYTIQVSVNQNFTTLAVNQKQKTASYQVNGLPAGMYYWRVNGLNASGASAWSPSRSFTLVSQNIPPKPTFSGIANGDTVDASGSRTISWGSEPGWNMRLVIVTGTDTVLNTPVSGTSYTVSGVLSSCAAYTLYGRYEKGGLMSPQTTINFRTYCLQPVPILLSPPNGAKNVNAANVPLVWNQSGGTVMVSKTSSFTNPSDIVYSNVIASGNSVTIQLPAFHDYWWRVGNTSGWSATWTFYAISVITGIDEESVPTEFKLLQNYPNPFNPTTRIRFSVPQTSFVTLKVYDVLGREVATLVNQEKNLGNYEVSFDASRLPSGMYIYKIDAGSFHQVKKMILMK